MSSLALRAEGDLLADYAAYVRALGITSDCKRVRVRAAECLLALHPDLRVWTARPTRTRVADIKRTRSWPFLAWCFIHRRVLPDLDLLVSKTPGAIYADWRALRRRHRARSLRRRALHLEQQLDTTGHRLSRTGLPVPGQESRAAQR